MIFNQGEFMFKVAGVSKMKGKVKVRFANEMSRVKVLDKGGHTNINLIELPKAMKKGDVVKFLLSQKEFTGENREALKAADVKYNGATTVKVTAKKGAVKVKAKAPAKVKTPEAAPEITPEVTAPEVTA